MSPKECRYRVGDIVQMSPRTGSLNGSGDGVLWRVTCVNRSSPFSRATPRIHIEPVWCATGRTSLRSKVVGPLAIADIVDFIRLGELRMQLDDLCREALKHEAGIDGEDPLTLEVQPDTTSC